MNRYVFALIASMLVIHIGRLCAEGLGAGSHSSVTYNYALFIGLTAGLIFSFIAYKK